MFISPALRHFDVVILRSDVTPDTPVRVASALFKRLLGQCPNIKRLSLLPSVILEPNHSERRFLETAWQKLEAPMGYASQLTEMSITSMMLPVFAKLSSPPFPVLENLRIHDSAPEDMGLEFSARDLFPNVRKLAVFELSDATVLQKNWQRFKPITGQLTHVELGFQSRYWFKRATILDKEISSVAIHCPRVVDLCLRPNPSHEGGRWLVFELKAIIFLDKLPLERFRILDQCFGSFLPPEFRPRQAFSLLKALELPRHRVATFELPRFAEAMPLLEYLSVNLQLDDNTRLPEGNMASKCTTLRRLESSFDRPAPLPHVSDTLGSVSNISEVGYTSALEFTRYL